MNTLNMGVVGHGFVGKAVSYGFDTPNVNTFTVDPNYNTTIKDMFFHFYPHIIFVSVPTPMNKDGEIDASIITDVMIDISKEIPESDIVVVVKSTVTPDIIKKLEAIYSRIVFNPEFLTERDYVNDFINPPMQVFGGSNISDLKYVERIYDDFSKCKAAPVYYTDLEAAAMIKYTINSFLATKVLFFNQMNAVFNKCGTDMTWQDFTDIVSTDERLGNTHLSVPGPDGRRGYGGACFPKDTTALVKYAYGLKVDFSQLRETIKANQSIRIEEIRKNGLESREQDQNVKFDIL